MFIIRFIVLLPFRILAFVLSLILTIYCHSESWLLYSLSY